jgi:hypothetical protein
MTSEKVPPPVPLTDAPDTPDAAATIRSALSVVTTVGTPLTLITALMLYFGWARSNAQSSWMGVDVSLFRFSAQDYVLRSISTLFLPLVVTGVVGIVWLAIHQRIRASIRTNGPRSAAGRAGSITMCLGVAAALAGVVLAAMRIPWPPGSVAFPLLITAGTTFAAYGRQLTHLAKPASAAENAVPRWQVVLQNLLIGAVIALATFWAVGEYAAIVGRGFGQDIEGSVSALPRATAISESPLGIEAPNVATNPISLGPKTLYRTTGLRLLGESGGRLFLLNDGWTRRTGSIVVLDNDKSVRWQFSR